MSAADRLAAPESIAERILRHFRVALEERGYSADPQQQHAIEHLANWLEHFLQARHAWFHKPTAGVYLWGDVGRGKSFVMDAFFAAAPLQAKRRVHFHAFLDEMQARLQAFAGQAEPLAKSARCIAGETRLLCFDEFHVHDIGDAMLLGPMLQQLVDRGVGLVCTSNYPPAGLCADPLYGERLRPVVGLIESRFEVLALDNGEDYRRRLTPLDAWGSYLWPATADDPTPLRERFGLGPQARFDQVLQVNHHPLCVRAHDDDHAWLDFAELFERPHSAADYLWLIERFPYLAVSGLEPLQDYPDDVARRFLNFIDIAYDKRLKLQLYATVPLERLAGGSTTLDFERTLSRLRQMTPVPLAAAAP
ncbi:MULTISPECIES: cell division protein ZapE [Pseudomonas]|uniref:cell division protein ZapE n=1 Tax=Pseudomonas TaxID=286 RepID=UPI0023D82703|nr:cell division protein ZapE [Pseudomonas sp. 273]